MNINEIAKLAGVSASAVSRYLNQGYLSEEKRKKIAEVIEQTGYVPSSQAQMLRTKKTKLIGVIIPKIDSDSISRIVAGISEVLSAAGYQMILANTDNQADKELEYINTFRQNMVDGIIHLGTINTAKHRAAFKSVGIPFVMLGQVLENISCIYHDDYHAAAAMTEYVIERGHRKIGYIGVTKKDKAVGVDRKQGFLDVMEQHGLQVDEDAILSGPFSIENGYQNTPILLEKMPDLDAIICATDTIALGVIKYLNEKNIKIPDEVAVAGFGDSKFSSILTPGLTTIHFYYRECGVEGAKMLLEKLQNPGAPDKSLRLGFELIQNGSV